MTKSGANVDVPRAWDEELVRRFGLAAKEARGRRSAKWLADRTEELGMRVSPTVIAKLDSGHRGGVLQVSELLIIAAALEVPPLQLIFPDLPLGEVEAVPGVQVTSIAAVQWVSGEYALHSSRGLDVTQEEHDADWAVSMTRIAKSRALVEKEVFADDMRHEAEIHPQYQRSFVEARNDAERLRRELMGIEQQPGPGLRTRKPFAESSADDE